MCVTSGNNKGITCDKWRIRECRFWDLIGFCYRRFNTFFLGIQCMQNSEKVAKIFNSKYRRSKNICIEIRSLGFWEIFKVTLNTLF